MPEIVQDATCPYDIRLVGSELHVSIKREFESLSLAHDWAHTLVTTYPGPYALVTVDMSMVGLVSSTFFAGLIKLTQHYRPLGAKSVTLIKPDPRVVRNLKILRLESLFTLELRPA